MKKIIMFLFVVGVLFGLTACGKDKTFAKDVWNGKFAIENKTYSTENLHEQLIANGWVADEYAKIQLTPNAESIVSYYHNNYGMDISDFHIDVIYYNEGSKDANILTTTIKSIIITRTLVEKYPSFALDENISFNSTMNELSSIYRANEATDNTLKYFGTADSKVKEVYLQFDDEKKLETVVLTFMKK